MNSGGWKFTIAERSYFPTTGTRYKINIFTYFVYLIRVTNNEHILIAIVLEDFVAYGSCLQCAWSLSWRCRSRAAASTIHMDHAPHSVVCTNSTGRNGHFFPIPVVSSKALSSLLRYKIIHPLGGGGRFNQTRLKSRHRTP